MKKILLSIAGLSAFFISQNVKAQLDFAPAVNYEAGVVPLFIASADFNKDGKNDLAVANFISDSVSIMLGSGTGTFANPIKYQVGSAPASITSSDFNGDGKLDLAVANAGSANISVLLGNGNGAFGTPVNYTVAAGPRSVAASDFNSDGNIDLAVANQSSNKVSVLLGNGNGAFSTPVYYSLPSAGPESIICADFNNDNKIDLATANPFTSNASVLLGNGDGTFATPVNFVTNGCRSICSNDFNGDSNADIAVANYNNGTMAVLLGDGAGSFAPRVNYPVGNSPYSIVSADFDKDGKIDLALANSGSNEISVLVGSGTGTFSPAVNYNAGNGSRSIVSNDFNSDGSLDLATANLNSNDVSVFLNTTPFGASLNFDGTNDYVQIADNANLDFGSGDFTVEYWVNKKAGSSSFSNTGGVNKWNTGLSSGTNEWLLGLTHTGNDNLPSFWVESGTTTYKCPATTSLILNTWYHIAAVREGANIKIFVNGNLENTVVVGNISINNVSRDLLIGKINSGVNASMSIDELRIWNVARTQCEIKSYKDCEIPTTASGLIINSHFNQGFSNTANSTVATLSNVSGTANTGTLFNFALTGLSSNWVAPGAVASGYTTSLAPPTISVNSGAICVGQSFTMVPSGAVTYTYSNGTNVVTPTVDVTYSVSGTDANGCVSNVDAVSSVTVNALPTISVNSGTTCSGSSFTMTPSGGITYTYTNGGSVATPTANSSYTVIGTDANGCIESAVSTVTIIALPVILVNNGSICTGNTFTMTPTGATSYTYSNGSNTVSPTAFTTYTVTGTDANGCVGSAESTVLVNGLPTITVNSGVICAGQSFTMVPSGATTYTYSNGSDVVTPTADATYSVSGTDLNGCVSSTDAVSSVTVNALPTITVNSGVICAGQSFTMVPSGATTYTYSNGSDVVTPTADAIYSVSGTDLNGCVSSTDAVSSVTVNALPVLTTSTTNTLLCSGETATLSVTGAVSYTWSTTENTTDIIVTPTVQATYTVDGIDANGCANTTTITQDISLCTGVVTLSGVETTSIEVYPNPNNGLFVMELISTSKVTVTNALGQVIIAQTFEAGKHTVDIHNEATGVYFVKVIENNKQQMIRLIKQ